MLVRHINGIVGQQVDGFSGASFVTDHGRLAVPCWMNPPQITPQGCGLKTDGSVPVHHVKSLDLTVRKTKYIEKVPEYLLKEVLEKLEGFSYD